MGLLCVEGECVNECDTPEDCADRRCVVGVCVAPDSPVDAGASDAAPGDGCADLPDRTDAIVDVALGDSGACAATAAGAVWCWGYWPGLGVEEVRSRPFRVLAEGGATLVARDVAVGSGFGCARSEAGTVACWGDVDGQGGLDVEAREISRRSDGARLSGASEIGAGRQHACALVGREVFCWGRNFMSGALGDGSTEDSEQAVLASALGSDARALIVGYRRTHALLGDAASLVGVGVNDQGELGGAAPTPAPGFSTAAVTASIPGGTAVIAPGDATCFLVDGGPRCWGYGPCLGEGATMLEACAGECTTSPVVVSVEGGAVLVGLAGDWDGNWALGWTASGRVYGWGSNEGLTVWPDSSEAQLGRASASQGFTGATHLVAIGGFAACAIEDVTGRLLCWGANRQGELGRGTITDHEPIAASVCWATS